MGVIEDTYADLDTDVSEEEFSEAVESKIEQMGGLADEETAAMLIAHELDEGEVEGIADIEPGMEEVKFLGKVQRVGEVRTFDRDGEDSEGQVLNVEVADETSSVRIALWDEQASSAVEQLEDGQVLRIKGRPKEGYNGLEVSVDQVEPDEEVEIDVPEEEDSIEALSLGRSDVNIDGVVLDTGTVRTFDRDDGSEGRVANLALGDETGRIRVTLWGEKADRVTELTSSATVEVVDGYVRERNGDLELHVGSRGAIEEIAADVEYVPDTTPIGDLEIGQRVDIGGVIRSGDPKRTFDRDDGSEGQVRNVRIQDDSGDIRVALWSEKADREIGPGDEVTFTDVEIQDGWRDDLEASAGWRSSIVLTNGNPESDPASNASRDGGTEAGTDAETDGADTTDEDETSGGLSAFADGTAPESDSAASAETTDTDTDAEDAGGDSEAEAGASEEFTGTVVQAGSPVILDDGERTIRFDADAGSDVGLGETVTVRGRSTGSGFELDELETHDRS
ncbi:replication factor A [Halobacteriales archaeon QS_3_64_16]|nr:MAG: replication factor A [Halobacteriales archaeon QS_3_64_16]